MAVREIEILLPVVSGDVVFASADMVMDRVPNRMIGWRHLVSSNPSQPEQFVNGVRGSRCQELASRIGVLVFGCTGHIDGPRCDEGDQLMLLDGQLVFAIVVLVK